MNEQFDSNKLTAINDNLEKIDRKLGNLWFSFAKGTLYGLGSIIGAGIAIILIGWFLTVIGVIPALKSTSDEWRASIQQIQDAKNLLPVDSAAQAQ